MIKIIKHGTRNINECDTCGCIFSFDEVDKNIRYEGGTEEYEYIECPQCKMEVILRQKKKALIKTLY